MNHIAVFNDVVLAFEAPFSSILRALLAIAGVAQSAVTNYATGFEGAEGYVSGSALAGTYGRLGCGGPPAPHRDRAASASAPRRRPAGPCRPRH